eukprot:6178522-Pleurochrysis_carterae.AAC.1
MGRGRPAGGTAEGRGSSDGGRERLGRGRVSLVIKRRERTREQSGEATVPGRDSERRGITSAQCEAHKEWALFEAYELEKS